jgi:hypothetical protein
MFRDQSRDDLRHVSERRHAPGTRLAFDASGAIRKARGMSNIVPFTLLSAVTVLDSSSKNWKLLEGPGDAPRKQQARITFETPFAAPPLVHVGIVGLDASKDDNLRVRVRAVDITAASFVIEAETWLHTRIWAVEVSWLAIGT